MQTQMRCIVLILEGGGLSISRGEGMVKERWHGLAIISEGKRGGYYLVYSEAKRTIDR